MTGSALTPDLALDYLGELSTDIEAVVVIDRDGSVAAATGDDADRSERMRELITALLDRAADAAPGTGIDQLEVTTAEGSVFAVRGRDWTVGVVAGRKPLASLMFYDLRNVVSELGDGADELAPGDSSSEGSEPAPGSAS